ncbi:Uncharacterised protein [Yersinia intermedia]|nr:Uncharacterised protein [Yersinia intermedia]
MNRIFQVIGSEVRITHGNSDVRMSQDALQDNDIAAAHHKVAGERVAQDVRHLTFGQLNTRQLDHPIKLFVARGEGRAFACHEFVIKRAGKGNRAVFLTFGIDEREFIRRYL